MAEHYSLEFNSTLKRLGIIVAESLANIRDFQSALKASHEPDVIINEYESRALLQKLSDDSEVN